MTDDRDVAPDLSAATRLFEAEAAYAQSEFLLALRDIEGSIAAAERALMWKPDYPPAVLTMGSIEYQRGREEEGARLFRSLPSLPDEDGDLWEVIDGAGDFLIEQKRYAEGLELYGAAVRRFPDRATLYQGLSCCACHEGSFDRAVEAARKAVELEPARPEARNDLGWSLFSAGRLEEAEEVLQRAVAMDPTAALDLENLRICRAARADGSEAPRE